MKRIIVSILVVMVYASQLTAATERYVDNNAALRYLMATGFMPHLSEKTADQIVDLNSLESLKKLKSEARKELISANGFMKTISRLLDLAADCTDSTFIVDHDYSDDSITPPFRTIRLFSRFINAHGWLDAEKGDYTGAVKKFMHVFRIGASIGHDGCAIHAMVGIAIQRTAIESINNLLKLDSNVELKKNLSNYFENLPKPVFDSTIHLRNEKLFIDNTLMKAEKAPEIFAELFADESKKSLSETVPEKPLPEAVKKSNEYFSSDNYVKDKMEIDKIFVELQEIDPYTEEAGTKADRLMERIQSSKSKLVQALVLNPKSFYKALRENQQRIDNLIRDLKR